MSKVKKVIIGILLVLLCGTAALAVWQWDNISAALTSMNLSRDEIEEKMKENDQAIKDAVNANPDVSVRDLTEEEKQALKDGTTTEQELIDKIVGKDEKPDEGQGDASAPGTSQQPDPPRTEKSEYEQKLSEIIARFYVLREQYLIKLDNVKDQALADYAALTPEQLSGSGVTDLVGKYLSIGTELEKECDKKIDALIAELEALLKANNKDMELADTVFQTYVNEKSLKKAMYLSEVMERGLI